MEQFEFHDAVSHSGRAWIEEEPGIHSRVLNEDTISGRKTVLQRWEPNSSNIKHIYIHPCIEEIYIAEGDLADIRLNQKWEKGAYAYRSRV
jgi:hypothetical protein